MNTCNRYAICLNTFGSFECTCKPGFSGNGSHCVDIDECLIFDNADEVLCNNTGKCINTVGYYRCKCQNGYTNPEMSNGCIGNDFRSFNNFLVNNHYLPQILMNAYTKIVCPNLTSITIYATDLACAAIYQEALYANVLKDLNLMMQIIIALV